MPIYREEKQVGRKILIAVYMIKFKALPEIICDIWDVETLDTFAMIIWGFVFTSSRNAGGPIVVGSTVREQ